MSSEYERMRLTTH